MLKYNGLSETQAKLLEGNVIDLVGDVNDKMAFYVRECIMRLLAKGSPPIEIFISSGGGSVDHGLDIYDMLKLYHGEKTAIVVGYARSMAAVILQACTIRKVAKHASILIHYISRREISLDVLRDEKKLSETKDSMEKNQAYLDKILGERTGKDVQTIKDECGKNKDMTADEALLFGLVDQII